MADTDNRCDENNPKSREEWIASYFEEGYKHKEIVMILSYRHGISLSVRQLKRILRTIQLKRRNIPESSLEEIVSAILDETNASGSCLGYKTLWSRLRTTYGLNVKRETVSTILRIVDPEGVESRAIHRFRRRKYSVPGPNFLWHVDGYDKLKPFGFAIHGCLDGFSRKILWLEVAFSNNNREFIAYYYLHAVKKIGYLPTMLRSDRGTENVIIECLQECLRMNHTDKLAGPKSYIKGKSTSNQRIESFWCQLRKLGLDFWISYFKNLRDNGAFDDSNGLHVECLRYCFGPLLIHDLEQIQMEWNKHSMRKQKNSNLLFGKPDFMFYCPEYYQRKNYGKDISSEDVDCCLEKYCIKPELYGAKFNELVELTCSLQNVHPMTVDDALKLYLELIDFLDSYKLLKYM